MLFRKIAHGSVARWDAGRVKTTDLDDRQALAALGTAGCKDFAAALSLGTGAKTNLTGALFAMRTEGGLHGMKLIKS
jgi:hypothetical protein